MHSRKTSCPLKKTKKKKTGLLSQWAGLLNARRRVRLLSADLLIAKGGSSYSTGVNMVGEARLVILERCVFLVAQV